MREKKMQAICKQVGSENMKGKMIRENKMQAKGKRDNEKEKKMKTQNSKPKIKNLNTKRCMRSTYLVMMDTNMQREKIRRCV
jgi:hypothetical protein